MPWLAALCALAASGCQRSSAPAAATPPQAVAHPAYFVPDPATAGSLSGTVRDTGRPPAAAKRVDMSEEPACVAARHSPAFDAPLVLDARRDVANVFVYVKSGLAGKVFATPSTAVTITQQGCWFVPRVMGIEVGQTLRVVNADPVTHNIHPQAKINREWNHSQGEGDPALLRRFAHPEVMIPIKCNIHKWMHAYLGVVDNPYFAVTGGDGRFTLPNLPPGDYVIGTWHETLGTMEQRVTVLPSQAATIRFDYKGN